MEDKMKDFYEKLMSRKMDVKESDDIICDFAEILLDKKLNLYQKELLTHVNRIQRSGKTINPDINKNMRQYIDYVERCQYAKGINAMIKNNSLIPFRIKVRNDMKPVYVFELHDLLKVYRYRRNLCDKEFNKNLKYDLVFDGAKSIVPFIDSFVLYIILTTNEYTDFPKEYSFMDGEVIICVNRDNISEYCKSMGYLVPSDIIFPRQQGRGLKSYYMWESVY